MVEKTTKQEEREVSIKAITQTIEALKEGQTAIKYRRRNTRRRFKESTCIR